MFNVYALYITILAFIPWVGSVYQVLSYPNTARYKIVWLCACLEVTRRARLRMDMDGEFPKVSTHFGTHAQRGCVICLNMGDYKCTLYKVLTMIDSFHRESSANYL